MDFLLRSSMHLNNNNKKSTKHKYKDDSVSTKWIYSQHLDGETSPVSLTLPVTAQFCSELYLDILFFTALSIESEVRVTDNFINNNSYWYINACILKILISNSSTMNNLIHISL